LLIDGPVCPLVAVVPALLGAACDQSELACAGSAIAPSRTDGQSDGGGRAYGVEPTAAVFLQEQGDIEPHKRPPPQCLRIPDNDEKFISRYVDVHA
jgi:hypothetical protein